MALAGVDGWWNGVDVCEVRQIRRADGGELPLAASTSATGGESRNNEEVLNSDHNQNPHLPQAGWMNR